MMAWWEVPTLLVFRKGLEMGDRGRYRHDRGVSHFKHLFLERLETIDSLTHPFEAGTTEVGHDQFASLISACDTQQRRYIVEKLEEVAARLDAWRRHFGEVLEGDNMKMSEL